MLTSRVARHRTDPRWRFRHSHPLGLRASFVPLVIVTGAPAAGKTSYVQHHRNPDDLVLDLDELAHDLVLGHAPGTGLRPISQEDKAKLRDAKAGYFIEALRARNRILDQLGRAACPWPRAWLIVAEPMPIRRQWWADNLKPEQVLVVQTPEAECKARAAGDSLRLHAIAKYFRLYEARDGDTIISGSAHG